MEKTISGRAARLFMLLCSAVYFTSYMTRINYGAVITELIAAEGVTKEMAGSVSTAAFFTYGVGQLISGFIGDRIHPRVLIVIGMLATAGCNILMPFVPEPSLMILLWAVNGFSQALFWPPLVRMMATHLNGADYNKACVWVSAASSIATIVIYLLAPVCIAAAGWQLIFFIGAAMAVLMVVLWIALSPKDGDIRPTAAAAASSAAGDPDTPSLWRDRPVMLMIAMLGIVIILQGILRDGVTTWMPTLVSDTFRLSSEISILSGIVLPIFSMISYQAAAKINDRMKNEVACAALLFGIGSVSALVMTFLFGTTPIAAVLLMALITGCIHDVNLMLISRLPKYFGKYNKISTVSGLLNAFTYIGSAASTYGFAVLSETFGWHYTVISWFVIAALGTLVALLCIRKWKAFASQSQNK